MMRKSQEEEEAVMTVVDEEEMRGGCKTEKEANEEKKGREDSSVSSYQRGVSQRHSKEERQARDRYRERTPTSKSPSPRTDHAILNTVRAPKRERYSEGKEREGKEGGGQRGGVGDGGKTLSARKAVGSRERRPSAKSKVSKISLQAK